MFISYSRYSLVFVISVSTNDIVVRESIEGFITFFVNRTEFWWCVSEGVGSSGRESVIFVICVGCEKCQYSLARIVNKHVVQLIITTISVIISVLTTIWNIINT